ncbi:MAG: hypothetical protein NT015_01930 [Alphaproteobacteria bacterium]|nr:hypothetical protein [Alphaproteobacteria bacterium]
MSNAGGAIVAIRMRKEREIVATLLERGALSPSSAVPLGATTGLGGGALRSLIRNGAVVESGSASYYLDQDAYGKMRSQRRLRIALVLIAVLVAAAVSFFMSSNSP